MYYQREQFPQEISFTSLRDGNWESYSTDDMIRIGTKVSLGLLKLGVQPGDKIAVIVKENRPEWKDMAEDNLGKHKVPTLRNVAKAPGKGMPKAYMHNGVFKSLKEVVHFYNTRDVEDWPPPEVT